MKKITLKQFCLFFSPVFIFILHIPFVFARPASQEISAKTLSAGKQMTLSTSRTGNGNESSSLRVYDSLQLGSLGLGRPIFEYAIKGFLRMKQMGKIHNDQVISIVDFSQPSSRKRLFVIDLKNWKVLFNTYVAHGVQSGKEFANRFSNVPESNKSSLGFYETMNTYIGGNGYSLRLEGMERGINDNANRRDIVVHGAEYVDERLAHARGYIGRSWGCPAVPERLHRPIIDKIKNGTCLFIYSPDKNYLAHSTILNSPFSTAYDLIGRTNS